MNKLFPVLGLLLLVFLGCKDASSDSSSTKYRQVTTVIGTTTPGWQLGAGAEARLYGPTSFALYYPYIYPTGERGNNLGFFLTDTQNNAVRVLLNTGIHAVVEHAEGRLSQPWGVVQHGEYLYIADSGHNSIKRKKVGPGVFSIENYAGTGSQGKADGPVANASFSFPMGLSLSPDDKILVADAQNNAVRVIDVTTNEVVTLLNADSSYKKGEELPLNSPRKVIADAKNNLFIADFNNHVIRYYDGKEISVYAGGLGKAGWVDGQGTAARFFGPVGLTLDAAGNLYVADSFNNRIRKIDTNRQVTTYAGSGVLGAADGPSNQAQFYFPTDIAFEITNNFGRLGNLYVADQGNNLIRMIGRDLQ